MHLLPLDEDHAAVIIDDGTDGTWHIRFLNSATGSVDGYDIEGLGQITSATINPSNDAIWCIAEHGDICGLSRQMEKGSLVPEIPEIFAPFDVNYVNGRYYVCGSSMNAWFFDVATESWQPIQKPDPRPVVPDKGESETPKAFAERVMTGQLAYSRRYPPLFGTFAVGDDIYFVGGNGSIIRLRNEVIKTEWIDSGVRFITGHAEGDKAVLCGGDPFSHILTGGIEDGFEAIWEDEEAALYRTAVLAGTRYLGAGPVPDYSGPFLFTVDENRDLAAVATGLEPEPEHLRCLQSRGSVLWAADFEGVFRLKNENWQRWGREALI